MLVLAMEFSRGAQRGHRVTDIKEQTDERTQYARASGRHTAQWAPSASRRRVGLAPGCSSEQGPRVAPSKRNSDARCHTQSPQASRTGPPKGCGPPGAG